MGKREWNFEKYILMERFCDLSASKSSWSVDYIYLQGNQQVVGCCRVEWASVDGTAQLGKFRLRGPGSGPGLQVIATATEPVTTLPLMASYTTFRGPPSNFRFEAGFLIQSGAVR